MTKQHKTEIITSTKRGFAAMWESGGGMTSGGSATIITGRNGEARRPVYIRRGGHLACGDHALLTVHDGFYVVRAGVRRGTRSSASIWRILSTTVKDIDGEKWEAKAEMELVNSFSNGEWNEVLDERLEPAVEAAFRKASSYHCRSAYYIDTSLREEISEADKKRRVEEMRRQDAEREAKRQAKADRLAREKAEREAASKAAKEAGLGERLEAVNTRLEILGCDNLVELGNSYFKWGWSNHLYTEDAIGSIERQVEQMETEATEKERKRQVREQFQPKFEVFAERAKALGLELRFGDESVRLGSSCSYSYSVEGIIAFEKELGKKEAEVAEEQRKAESLLEDQRHIANGCPQDFTCRHERGQGKTHRDCWVIQPDGKEREADHEQYVRHKHVATVWNVIRPGEIALMWEKGSRASEHRFTVIHMQTKVLTDKQVTTICEILEELEECWDGAAGIASGKLSPSVGDGWLDPETGESLTKGFQTSRQKREQGDRAEEEARIEEEELDNHFSSLANLL